MGIGYFAKQSQEVLWNQQEFSTEAKSQRKANLRVGGGAFCFLLDTARPSWQRSFGNDPHWGQEAKQQ